MMEEIFCRTCGNERVVGKDETGNYCYPHFEQRKKEERRLASGRSACHGEILHKRFYCPKCWLKQDVDKVLKYEREKK